MIQKLAWYPWEHEAWRGSRRVLRLSLAARGLYRELLDECWRAGSVPDDPEAIAEAVFRPVSEVRRVWPAVRSFFEHRPDGRLYSERIRDLRREQEIKHRKAVENGRKGGRPKTKTKATLKPTETIRVETTLTTGATRPRPLGGGGPVALPQVVGSILPVVDNGF